MIRIVVTGAFAVAIHCCVMAGKASAEPIIFITSYHNLDYAATACELTGFLDPAGAAECKSVSDPRELGRRLENKLSDALAVTTRCAGVTVIRDPHPKFDGRFSEANNKIKQQKPHWNLHLDYNPGFEIFGWTLFPNKAGIMNSAGALVNGEGTVAKAAGEICTVVTGRGATIR